MKANRHTDRDKYVIPSFKSHSLAAVKSLFTAVESVWQETKDVFGNKENPVSGDFDTDAFFKRTLSYVLPFSR